MKANIVLRPTSCHHLWWKYERKFIVKFPTCTRNIKMNEWGERAAKKSCHIVTAIWWTSDHLYSVWFTSKWTKKKRRKKCFQNLLSANCLSPRTTCILSSSVSSFNNNMFSSLPSCRLLLAQIFFVTSSTLIRRLWKISRIFVNQLAYKQSSALAPRAHYFLAIIMKSRVSRGLLKTAKQKNKIKPTTIVKCLSSKSTRAKKTTEKMTQSMSSSWTRASTLVSERKNVIIWPTRRSARNKTGIYNIFFTHIKMS